MVQVDGQSIIPAALTAVGVIAVRPRANTRVMVIFFIVFLETGRRELEKDIKIRFGHQSKSALKKAIHALVTLRLNRQIKV